MTTSSAPRVKRADAKKRKQGLKPVRALWAYPEDVPDIRKEAKRLRDKREAARKVKE